MKKHSPEEAQLLCRKVGDELRELVAAQINCKFNVQRLVEALLDFEAQVAQRHELIITASNTLDDWTVIKVYVEGEKAPCASFEFLPQTGRFRAVGTKCVEPCESEGNTPANETACDA
jgi:hypothetical protein